MADLYGTTDRIIGTESGGNPMARNPRSSAGGLGQFIDSTWLDTVKKHRPDIANGKTDAQLLQLKFDPSLSREMTRAYESDNATFLQARGIPPTPGNLKLAHFAGPEGAAKLHANPDAPVEAVLGRSAVAANPFLKGKRGADVVAWADKQMTGSKSPSQAMAANLTQRFGTKTEGGAIMAAAPMTGGSGVNAVAGGAGMDQLKSALKGKTYDPDKIAAYGNLTKAGQDVAGRATDWKQALLGIGTAGVGGYLQDSEKQAKREFDAQFGELASNAKTPAELAQILITSPDEKMRNAGLELAAKTIGQAPQSRTIDGPYGTKVTQDYRDGQWQTQGDGGAAPNFSAAPAPQAAPQPQAAPDMAVQPSPLPEPVQQPQQAPAPAMPVQNIGEVGPGPIEQAAMQPAGFAGQVPNVAEKGNMLPMGGEQPASEPQIAPPAPPPAVPAGFKIGAAVPKAPDNYVHKLASDGSGYLYNEKGQPVFETKVEAEERAKTAAKRAEGAPEKAITKTQIAGNLNALSGIINDTNPDKWNVAFGQFGGKENATLYEDPAAYILGTAKRGAVAAGEQMFGTGEGGSAADLRRKMDAPAADLVMTYRAIQKQRGVSDSQQSNADLAFLESVAGRLKETNSREAAYDILNTQVRPIFERLSGEQIKIEPFKELRKVKKPTNTDQPQASGDGWSSYVKQFGY